MKFGKLSDISNVDFNLNPTPISTLEFLDKLPKKETPPCVYVGATGWGMKEWVGTYYPKKTKSADFLHHYSKQFNTIELNTTHYRIPSLEMVAKWYQQSVADFKFCPKIPQTISHSRQLGLDTNYMNSFEEVILTLKEKLGACFIQLSPYFSPKQRPLLQQFLTKYASKLPIAVEFRQADWFHPTTFEKTTQLLRQYNCGTVITDVAGRRDVLHSHITTNYAMIRFVGNNLVPSDYQRIDDWVQLLKIWFEQQLKTVYFFTHEPDNIHAPVLATYLVEQLQQHTETIVRGPAPIKEDTDSQLSLF